MISEAAIFSKVTFSMRQFDLLPQKASQPVAVEHAIFKRSIQAGPLSPELVGLAQHRQV